MLARRSGPFAGRDVRACVAGLPRRCCVPPGWPLIYAVCERPRLLTRNPISMNRATSTVLLTGATGFLGSHLLTGLLASGHSVVVLKRSGSNTARIASQVSRVGSCDLD